MAQVVWILIAGGVGGALAVLLLAGLRVPPTCPRCGHQLPRFRRPASGRQAFWGGWTCPKCGHQVDRKGNVLGGS